MPPLSITIVSDVLCPWCLIGIKRLDDALASLPEVQATLHFRPFLLDPSIPKEGTDLRENLQKKFGNPEPMFKRVESAANESGIPLNFAKVRRSVNTIPAHTLLRKADEKGTQAALKRALLNAYFLEGRDVSEEATLVDIASLHGFTKDETHAILTSESELAQTRQEADRARREGVTGVPFFRFGNRFALSGAQPVETFRNAILQSMDATRGSEESLGLRRRTLHSVLAESASSEVGHLRAACSAQGDLVHDRHSPLCFRPCCVGRIAPRLRR